MAVKDNGTYFPPGFLTSNAYRSLKGRIVIDVLNIFMLKRKMKKSGPSGKPGKRKGDWRVVNNGEIIFTFLEARRDYDISGSTFRSAINQLCEKGFIDIVESGAGLCRSTNKYAISDRWKKYGTAEYEPPAPRPEARQIGFQKGNQYGRNCDKEKKSSVAD